MLSIIIPTYRAEKYIAATLTDYIRYFSLFPDLAFEVIVVSSGNSDKTSEIVAKYRHKYPRIIRHQTYNERLGKGAAIISGFKVARGDMLAFVDADESTSPEEMYKLISRLKDYDGVIASRWLPESKVVVKQSVVRRIASRGFNLLVRIMFGLKYKDTQCGAKVFRKPIIDKIIDELRTTDFVFDVELLFRLGQHGYKLKEVSTTWTDSETSTVSLLKAVPCVSWSLLTLRVSNSFLRRIYYHRNRS